LRQYGRKTRWIARVCDTSTLESVEARFAKLSVEEAEDGTLAIDDPDYGRVLFRKDGSAQAEGRTIAPQDFPVAGEIAMLTAK
jgi:hypothetical protein